MESWKICTFNDKNVMNNLCYSENMGKKDNFNQLKGLCIIKLSSFTKNSLKRGERSKTYLTHVYNS